MKKIITQAAVSLRPGQEVSLDGGITWGRVKHVQALVVMEDDTKRSVRPTSVAMIREDDPELCPNGQPIGTECREIDPCEMCQQDLDEEGDKIEASMGLRKPVVEDDDEDDEDYDIRGCRGCEGTCCTGVNGIPCSC